MNIVDRNKSFMRGYEHATALGTTPEQSLGNIVSIGEGVGLEPRDESYQLGFFYGAAELVAKMKNLPAEVVHFRRNKQ